MTSNIFSPITLLLLYTSENFPETSQLAEGLKIRYGVSTLGDFHCQTPVIVVKQDSGFRRL